LEKCCFPLINAWLPCRAVSPMTVMPAIALKLPAKCLAAQVSTLHVSLQTSPATAVHFHLHLQSNPNPKHSEHLYVQKDGAICICKAAGCNCTNHPPDAEWSCSQHDRHYQQQRNPSPNKCNVMPEKYDVHWIL